MRDILLEPAHPRIDDDDGSGLAAVSSWLNRWPERSGINLFPSSKFPGRRAGEESRRSGAKFVGNLREKNPTVIDV